MYDFMFKLVWVQQTRQILFVPKNIIKSTDYKNVTQHHGHN